MLFPCPVIDTRRDRARAKEAAARIPGTEAAQEDRQLVADEPAAAVGEHRQSA